MPIVKDSKHFAIFDKNGQKHFAIFDKNGKKHFAIFDKCFIFAL